MRTDLQRPEMYFADTGDTSERHLPDAPAGGGGNYFDYDVPPEALADEKFAAMLAEAEKYLGYPYVWGGASPSTSFDCSGYVSWVVNHCGVPDARLDLPSQRIMPGTLYKFVPNNRQNSGQFIFKGGM